MDRVTLETLRHLGAKGMQQFVQGLQRLAEGDGPLAAPSHVHPQRRKEVRQEVVRYGIVLYKIVLYKTI